MNGEMAKEVAEELARMHLEGGSSVLSLHFTLGGSFKGMGVERRESGRELPLKTIRGMLWENRKELEDLEGKVVWAWFDEEEGESWCGIGMTVEGEEGAILYEVEGAAGG